MGLYVFYRLKKSLPAIISFAIILGILVGLMYAVGEIYKSRYEAEILAERPDMSEDEKDEQLLYYSLVKSEEQSLIVYAVFLAIVAVSMLFRRKNPAKVFSLKIIRPTWLIAFAVMGVSTYRIVLICNDVYIGLRGFDYKTPIFNYDIMYDGEYAPLWMSVIAFAVICPIVEELIFREIAMKALKYPFGEMGAILISSLAFSLCHSSEYQKVFTFFMGVTFALVYLRFGSIIPTILLHLAHNLSSVLGLFPTTDPLTATAIFAVSLLAVCVCTMLMLHYPWPRDYTFEYKLILLKKKLKKKLSIEGEVESPAHENKSCEINK